MGTSVTPDMLDAIFLTTINIIIWWTNCFNGVVEEIERVLSGSKSYVDILRLGILFIVSAILGYALGFILSFILFILSFILFIPLCVILGNPPVLAVRIAWMAGTCNGMVHAFKQFDTAQGVLGGIIRLGLALGASLFFAFFSSNVYYTWERMGEVWMGEVTSFDHKYFLPKS